MLLDTNTVIALKKNDGQYIVKDFTVFKIASTKDSFSSLNININKNKELLFEIRCPLCGEIHKYIYTIPGFVKRNMIIGGCEQLGVPIFLVGKREKVIKKVQEHREITQKIYAMI